MEELLLKESTMIKPIMRDTQFLAQKAVPATPADTDVLTDLRDTLQANTERCVGMAANMIGINKRIIIVQMGVLPVILVNPQIVRQAKPYQTTEGCLSLNGERPTTRYETIEVTYQDQSFKPHKQAFSGWIAQIIQHEVDHCEGLSFKTTKKRSTTPMYGVVERFFTGYLFSFF